MRRSRVSDAVLVFLAGASLVVALAGIGAVAAQTAVRVPQIDERHIFEGGLNKQGRLVGFHHAGPHRDRLVRIVRGPNALGVYEAEFRAFGMTKRSTFFPDAWTREQVLAAIREAYLNPIEKTGGKIVGKTASGMRIQIYLDRAGDIATAFPIYEARLVRE
jgi:hypothetical protein